MGGDSSNTGKNVSPIKGPKIELYVQQPFYEQLAWHHSGAVTATAAAKRCGCKGAMAAASEDRPLCSAKFARWRTGRGWGSGGRAAGAAGGRPPPWHRLKRFAPSVIACDRRHGRRDTPGRLTMTRLYRSTILMKKITHIPIKTKLLAAK